MINYSILTVYMYGCWHQAGPESGPNPHPNPTPEERPTQLSAMSSSCCNHTQCLMLKAYI